MALKDDQLPDLVAYFFAIGFILWIPITIFESVSERPIDLIKLTFSDPLILLFFASLITLFTRSFYQRWGAISAFIAGYIHVWIVFLTGIYTAYQLSTM